MGKLFWKNSGTHRKAASVRTQAFHSPFPGCGPLHTRYREEMAKGNKQNNQTVETIL